MKWNSYEFLIRPHFNHRIPIIEQIFDLILFKIRSSNKENNLIIYNEIIFHYNERRRNTEWTKSINNLDNQATVLKDYNNTYPIYKLLPIINW